jgi:peroxiredoxin
LAEYGDIYPRIRESGTDLAAVAVDSPAISESVRQQLRLPFPILCDTERRVIREWGILNEKEGGGIAVPSVFVLDTDRRIRFQSIDSTTARVPAAAVLNFLSSGRHPVPSQELRKTIVPGPLWFGRALRNQYRSREK